MKKYYALAAMLLMTGTGAFAAGPEGVSKAVESCCSALAACCKAAMGCCG
ncbi:MAG: hypothetical protein H0W65_07505 [Sphingomonas sp.]|nr:hypothetical protein [Sphingomonas sp.]MBA3667551.1 hypothetical protein [Sphingomonas sp.]